jgi:hypothetical protein
MHSRHIELKLSSTNGLPGTRGYPAYRVRAFLELPLSRGCSQEDLVATGRAGLFYCFAAQ